MHSKIYKAKLLAVHGQSNDDPPSPQSHSIHTYFGMLQHIFQRNKHMIRQLKLSGTRIQHPNGSIVRGIAPPLPPSESTRHPLSDKKPTEHTQHIRSLTSHRPPGTLSSSRNFSTQTRYKPQNKSLQHDQENNIQEVCSFVPIGQASQRKFQTPRKTTNPHDTPAKKINHISIKLHLNTSKNSLQSQTERRPSVTEKKQSLRMNRGQLRSKTQQPQQITNNSSIRSSQKSNYQIHSCVKLVPPQSVTPW